MDAIILAGGAGKRMQQLGQVQYKPLLPVPTERGIRQVIDSNIDKLLEVESVSRVSVLIREEHRRDFERWRTACYPRQTRKVPFLFEEKLEQEIGGLPKIPRTRRQGAIWGLYLAVKAAKVKAPLIVVAGDNYFTDPFDGLIKEFQKTKKSTIVYHDLRFRELVRDRYGILRLARKSRRITEFVEKPAQPLLTDTKAAIACYCFDNTALDLLHEYVENTHHSLDAPGHFAQWLIHQTEVLAFEFKGRWWDVGTPRDYADVLRLMSRTEFRTVGDLLRAKQEDRLQDAYFLIGRRFAFDLNSSPPTIRIIFAEADALCRDDEMLTPRELPTVKEVKAAGRTVLAQLDALEEAVNNPGSHKSVEFAQGKGVLLSGGVFLYDSPPPSAGLLQHNVTFVPLLERDFAAPADPGRMTTPAGRLDDLDLTGLCYTELLEEMAFYGVDHENDIRLFTIFPFALRDRYEPRRRLLKRLITNNVRVPGIDQDILAEQATRTEEEIDIVRLLDPVEIPLPTGGDLPVWRVELEVEGRLGPQASDSVYVVVDKPNRTLEFRKVVCAQITHFSRQRRTKPAQRPAAVNAFGRLTGIADADGYGRRTFLMTAEELAAYYRRVNTMTREELVDYLLFSEVQRVTIAAAGDPGNSGRFFLFHTPVAALSLTTSVREMARLTAQLLTPGWDRE